MEGPPIAVCIVPREDCLVPDGFTMSQAAAPKAGRRPLGNGSLATRIRQLQDLQLILTEVLSLPVVTQGIEVHALAIKEQGEGRGVGHVWTTLESSWRQGSRPPGAVRITVPQEGRLAPDGCTRPQAA